MPNCPLCQRPDATSLLPLGDYARVQCATCGEFEITNTAMVLLPDPQVSGRRWVLSGLARREAQAGRRLRIAGSELQRLVASEPGPKTLVEALDQLLLYVRDNTKSLRGFVNISASDYPVIFARDESEFGELLRHLVSRKLIENPGNGKYRLTLEGWQQSEALRRVRVNPHRAFVAMWFDPSVEDAWQSGIKPALRDAGYDPIRIDAVQHNDRIDDRILAEIRQSGLLVADFTGNRGGVYFEAGFALGLGIPVIWTCRKDELKHVHFDTRQYNHVTWEDPADLRENLKNRVLASLPLPQA